MRFAILGALRVVADDGRELVIGSRVLRAVLAILLLHRGEVISSDRLAEELWAAEMPATATKSLQVHISRLRRALSQDVSVLARLETVGHGYRLVVKTGEFDAGVFEQLAADGRQSLGTGEPDEAIETFTAALELWQGAPLSEFEYEPFAQAEIARLGELRIEALEQIVAAELELGRNGQAISRLERLVRENPYREHLRGQLMVALYRMGRQAEALEQFRDLRSVLVEELGIEPSRELRELQERLLAQDPSLLDTRKVAAPQPDAKEPDRPALDGGAARSDVSGIVTMLFTDIEGSTEAARALGDLWPDSLASHHRILERAIREHHGVIEGVEGDSFFATFRVPGDAFAAAADAQETLRGFPWPSRELRVRMGIHTGVLERTATGTTGLEIHRAARIAAAAHGRQVVVSSTTRALAPEAWVLEDLGEHRLKDFPQPERLFHLVIAGLARGAFAPLRTLPARPTNIPAFDNPVIGRTDELERLLALLTSDAQLVTVTGRGGTGKTRLALAAGEQLLADFPGGVWFVPLADVESSARMLATITATIGVADDGEGVLLDKIVERLQNNATLLILDNLEQLHGAAQTIEQILGAASGARILATSQIPLQLSREHLVALGPLQVEGGVQLFLERAGRIGAQTAGEGSLAAVKVICERLDGLPLAIELAAARTVVLTTDELLQRLTESFDILTSRERDRPARQRSLRATIEWSLGLLEPADANLFLLLTTFADTFTVTDAEAIAGPGVFEGLESLVESSFVRRVATRDYAARFTIAQALRDFGREQLVAGGRFESARLAHACWVLSRVEQAWQALIEEAPDHLEPVAGIGEDVYLARAFLKDHDPVLHLQLLGGYAVLGTDQNLAVELGAELTSAIGDATDRGPALARAQLAAGEVAVFLGEPEVAFAHLTHARELSLEFGPAVISVLALRGMSYVRLSTDVASARAFAEQAVAESASSGGRMWSALALAQVDIVEGRVEIEPLLGELLEQVENIDYELGLRHYYADCALLREDGPVAVHRYADAVRIAIKRDRDVNIGDLEGLAMSLALVDRPQDALEVDAIAEAHRMAFGANWKVAYWEALRDRHLDAIRRSTTPRPDPATLTDLDAALDRAVALADAAQVAS